jgi:uncharacterized membrane protein YphA (DoxX/SURF4 family)/thioredoxin-related protein
MGIKLKNTIVFIIFLVTGVVFIFSGVSKIGSLDSFELYVYSLDILNLPLTSLFTRLLISVEIFCGILLFIPLYRRFAWYLSLSLLFLFSVYLIIILLSKNTADCHCFGDFIRLKPIYSLLKNIVLILLLFPIRWWLKHRKQNLIVPSVLFISILIIITLLFPSTLLYQKKNRQSAQFNYVAYKAFSREDTTRVFRAEDRPMMLCFFSSGCKYCKLAARKITLIAKTHSIPRDRIVFIFRKNARNLDNFFLTSESERFPTDLIEPRSFFQITGGVTPQIILKADSEVYAVYGFRNLDEGVVVSFLKAKGSEQ